MSRSIQADRVRGRAESRKSWPVKRFRLGDEPRENLRDTTTVAERLAMLTELTDRAWGLSGREIRQIPRSELPVLRRKLRAES